MSESKSLSPNSVFFLPYLEIQVTRKIIVCLPREQHFKCITLFSTTLTSKLYLETSLHILPSHNENKYFHL